MRTRTLPFLRMEQAVSWKHTAQSASSRQAQHRGASLTSVPQGTKALAARSANETVPILGKTPAQMLWNIKF